MKKTGVKECFELGQLAQIPLFEQFKKLHVQDDESVEDCESSHKKKFQKLLVNNFQEMSDKKKQDISPKNSSKNINHSKFDENNVKVEMKKKKLHTSQQNVLSVKDYTESVSSKDEEDKQIFDGNDSKKMSRKDSIDYENTAIKQAANQEGRSPVQKQQRRASRRFPVNVGNISALMGQSLKVGAAESMNAPIQPKIVGGFFFAMKMKKYANQLVSRLQSRRYLALRAKHLQFFNDKTIVPDEEKGIFKVQTHQQKGIMDEPDLDISVNLQKQVVSWLKTLYKKHLSTNMKKVISKCPIFQPSHTGKLIWDFLNMVSIAYFLIFFPLRITFGLDLYNSVVSYLALGVIICDTFVNLNTGFYDKGTLITDRIGILMHYIDKRLLTDFSSLIPFFVYDFSNIQQNVFSDLDKSLESIISLLFLVRLFHLQQIKKKIEERFYQKKTLTHIFSLFTLLLNTLYIAHLFSCLWIIIAEFKKDSSDTWLSVIKIDTEDWIIKYLYSLYFLIITMSTVGYGDIRPQNNLEHLVIIIIVLISSGVFSFSINKIGTIVQQMAEEKERVKETLQVINNYMHKKIINMSLQQQIREYLEYYLKESLMNNTEREDKIIQMLSEPLKRSLMIEANKIALKDSPIFRNNFSESTIQKTVSLIQELRCTPEEVIFYEGDIDNCAIFFVQQGKVELFIDSYKNSTELQFTSLKVFQEGSSFGETSFFTGLSRGISIRSIDFTTLLMIKRQDFLNVVKESSDDYENFCKIKDNIVFYKNYDDIGIKCFSCNSPNHFLNDCPYIHYVTDKQKIIKMYQLPSLAERQEFDNDCRALRFNVFENLQQIQEDALTLFDTQGNFIEAQDWYDGNAEDEEEYEFYNQYGDDEEEEEEEEHRRKLEGGVGEMNIKNYYKQFEGNNDQVAQVNVHASSYREEPNFYQSGIQGRARDDIYNNNNLQNPIATNVGETHSTKSGYRPGIILEVDEGRKERTFSNLGLNDLTLTPSGLLLNLINPNPGNIRENSQNLHKRKRSTSNSIINNNTQLLKKCHTLQADDQLQQQQVIITSNLGSNFSSNLTPSMSSPALPLMNTNINSGSSNTLMGRKSSLVSNNVRKNTKRKNTDMTLRSAIKRRSTKHTIDSRMNVQTGNNNYLSQGTDRKSFKKVTLVRKGIQENQINNTLLALQGMENILLQNKVNPNENEFDVMKSFEIYFPHNNIDVVIFQLRKKNPHLYAKQKSFVKQNTKKLMGAMTMNSTHNRMSKMDLLLNKFLMSEVDEEKDKESIKSNRLKSFTHNTHKTPKMSHTLIPGNLDTNNNTLPMCRHRERTVERKNSCNHPNRIDLNEQCNFDSPASGGKKCKSLRIINTPNQKRSKYQRDDRFDLCSPITSNNQEEQAHESGYLQEQYNYQNKPTHNAIGLTSCKLNSNHRILLDQSDLSPQKNASFQENLDEFNLQL